MTESPSNLNPHEDVLDRIMRGLSGYVSYLAACEMNSAFSEYVLYEPILRVLMARDYEARCEVECPGFERTGSGDHKRIDFVAKSDAAQTFAMEVKWVREKSIDAQADLEKLTKYRSHNRDALCFLCVFGRFKHISKIKKVAGFREFRKPVFAYFRKTQYGCRMYVLE